MNCVAGHLVDDGHLYTLDGHRRLIDAKHTRSLAWRWANTPRELWEVVSLKQSVQRLVPVARIYQVVPLRDLIAQWTSCVAFTDEVSAPIKPTQQSQRVGLTAAD